MLSQAILDQEWREAEKEIAPDFKGSLMEQLGFDDKLCPTCNANLKNGICLNACHLSKDARERFARLMNKLVQDDNS